MAVDPWQTLNIPVIVGEGLAFTTTDCEVLPVQPLPSVTVTVNVPAVVVLMDAVVAPVLQRYELKPDDAVSVDVAP